MRQVKMLVCGFLVFGLLGCGGEGKKKPETVTVSGTIMFKKAPLVDADVNFVSADGAFAAYGKTDATGKYTLVQGAVPGKNKVFISKKEGEDLKLDPEAGMDAAQFEAAQMNNPNAAKKPIGPIQLIPAEYSDPEKTKLEIEVPEEGTETANFTLQ